MTDKRSEWVNVISEGALHTMPLHDIKPHGTKQAATIYVLTADCDCQPTVVSMRDGKMLLQPHVIHNSFEDDKRINEMMERHFGI